MNLAGLPATPIRILYREILRRGIFQRDLDDSIISILIVKNDVLSTFGNDEHIYDSELQKINQTQALEYLARVLA